MNAINTVAAACNPVELLKTSIDKPNRKAEMSSTAPGISNGNKRMKSIYNDGLMYPPKLK